MLSPGVRCALVLALLAPATWWPATTVRAQDANGTPQTQPVLVWLIAVNSGDLEQLK